MMHFCVQMLHNLKSTPGVTLTTGILKFENHTFTPSALTLHEVILHDCHEVIGHIGRQKVFKDVACFFYWPNLRQDVEKYVRSCDVCQRTKSRTTKPNGKLRSLPIPLHALAEVRADFVGPVTTGQGFDTLLIITDRLNGYVQLVPTKLTDTAPDAADCFYNSWTRLSGLQGRF